MRESQKLKMEKLKEMQRVKNLRQGRLRNTRAATARDAAMAPDVENQLETNPPLQENSEMADEPTTMETPAKPSMPTLSLINNGSIINATQNSSKMTTRSKKSIPVVTEVLNLDALPNGPRNVKVGSLVVLAVNDPSSPSKKMLQTYIASGAGKLTPVAPSSDFLSSVEDFMENGVPENAGSGNSSPQY